MKNPFNKPILDKKRIFRVIVRCDTYREHFEKKVTAENYTVGTDEIKNGIRLAFEECLDKLRIGPL